MTGSHKRVFQLAKVNFSQMNQNSLRWNRSKGEKSLAKLSHDASLNGSENFSMGILSRSSRAHTAGSKG